MKIARIVSLAVVFQLACNSAPARAENFVEQFLNRYRPAKVDFSTPPAVQGQELENLIRTGQLQLTIGDVVNLMLENNLDIGANRLTPRSSEYLIETLYGVFEPTLRLQATVNRNTTPSTSVLAGSASGINLLSGQYFNPLRVIAFNLEEGWVRDASEEVARSLLERAKKEGKPLPDGVRRFVDRHVVQLAYW